MSFQTGLSGLNVTSKSLEVIGNNIANANTYGAKSSRAEFADMYASALNGASSQSIGIGVRMAAVAQQFTQGTISTTDNALDLAINGGGFFQMDHGGETLYSRNGQFKLDKEGFIINNDGMKLVGYQADVTGVIQPGVALPMQVPTAGIDPRATREIALEFNLDSRAEPKDPGANVSPRIEFTDATTYNKATSQTVYDSLGQPVSLTYYFQRVDNSANPSQSQSLWNVYLSVNGAPYNGTAADPDPLTTLDFGSDGAVPSPLTLSNLDIPASVNSAGAPTQAIADVTLSFEGSTQYGADFAVTDLKQDGFAPGSLSGIVVDSSGVVMARYTNGQSKAAGQLELANFRNVQGLEPVGGNNWRVSVASGGPIPGVAGTGNLGALQAGALEESNVDLTGELVNMITAQRNYQANAQTIKTMDQVMQTLVSLR